MQRRSVWEIMRVQFYPTKEPSKMKKTALRASALALFVAMAAGCATTGLDDVKATADRAAADAAAAASAAEAARAAADRAAQAASSAQSTADQALAAAKLTKKVWNACSRNRCPSKKDRNLVALRLQTFYSNAALVAAFFMPRPTASGIPSERLTSSSTRSQSSWPARSAVATMNCSVT